MEQQKMDDWNIKHYIRKLKHRKTEPHHQNIEHRIVTHRKQAHRTLKRKT